jgi:hypothetical protein
VDIFFFCYQTGIAFTDLQPFLARLKSEGLIIEPHFGVYAVTGPGYARYKRCAGT